MPRFTDLAFCLRDLDWSETSQVVVLLTEQHGKLRALAKGSRRQSPSSVAKFSGGINLLNLGQAIVTTKPAGQLAVVTEWDLRADFPHLRTSLAAQWSAMYAADLCGALLADEDPHPGAFAALHAFLDASAVADQLPGALLRFQWAMLSEAGYRPELERDVADGGALKPASTYSFDPRLGGLTARNGISDEHWRVRRQTVELLRAASAGALDPAADAEALGRANRLLCTYARALLDKELPTMGVVLNDAIKPPSHGRAG